MPLRRLLPALLILLCIFAQAAAPLPAHPGETVSTATVVADGILYTASYERDTRAGHLRAFALAGNRQTRLWDAAELMPSPDERVIFTAQGDRLISFAPAAALLLQPFLGAPTVEEATALINAVRGRVGTSAAIPAGSDNRAELLGAISRSSPVLVGGSPLDAAAAQRDRVLYVGGEDGALHAILAGRWSATAGGYEVTGDCGRELWAFLPGSFLAELVNGVMETAGYRSPIHVDGTPAVADVYIDGNGDGRREWRTVLVGTASVPARNRGAVFALDITEPYAPRLLWERALAGLGRSHGAAIQSTSGWLDTPPRVFVTAGSSTRIDDLGNPAPERGRFGITASALDLASGTLLWQFAAPYPEEAGGLADAPTAPAIMHGSAAGGIDAILFGDLAGRLWALDPATGGAIGGNPAWQSPGGAHEPIGGGFAIRGRMALFGTGGVEGADPHGNYAVYAVELLPGGARLLWNHALNPGERLWGTPALDRFGRAFFGVGDESAGGGRVLVVDTDGTAAGSVSLAGVPGGGVTLAPGALVTVSVSGLVEQIGALLLTGPDPTAVAGRVRLFSWRMR